MRRLFAFSALLCAVCLAAAAPRTTPRPPLPLPTVHFNFPSDNPKVLIYPFEVASGLNSHVGTQVATIFAHAMTQAGNVTVLPVPANVLRANYLTNAQSQKADYYVTGYVTPIGDSASVVVQVVSVQSGVIAFSQTSQVSTISDATSLALTSHDAILQMSGRSVSVTTTEAPTTAPSAQPTTNGANFSLGHLFSHHRAGTTPSPTTGPSSKPSRGVILIAVRPQTGASSVDAERATQLLEHDLAVHFDVRNGGAAPASLSAAANSICGVQRDNTIATGDLVVQHVGGIRPRTTSVFTLQIWTCFGDMLYKTTQTNRDVAKAVGNAVTDYITAHPDNG